MSLIAEENLKGRTLQVFYEASVVGVITAEAETGVEIAITGITTADRAIAMPQLGLGGRVAITACLCEADKITLYYSNSGDDNSEDIAAHNVLIFVVKAT